MNKCIYKSSMLLIVILTMLMLCSCQNDIINTADELCMYSWQAKLENNNVITLEFDDDYATMIVDIEGEDSVTISGLCEIDKDSFIIHDKDTKITFPFEYVVYFDCVDLTYDKNTVSLDKIVD